MKIQDFVFIIIFLFVLWRRNAKLSTALGLVALGLSMPLFAKWIFFTAQRLTYYSAAFFLYAIILLIKDIREN